MTGQFDIHYFELFIFFLSIQLPSTPRRLLNSIINDIIRLNAEIGVARASEVIFRHTHIEIKKRTIL